MKKLLLVTALLAGTAAAQVAPLPQFDLERFEVNSAADGSLVVGTGELLPPGSVRFSLAGDYENDPLVYVQDDGTVVGSVISDRYTVHLLGAWAPLDWLQAGLDVPIIASQTGVDLQQYGLPLPTRRGLGSPIASARMGLLSQRKGAAFDAALQVGARLPIGSDGAWARDSRVSLSPKLMLGRQMGWLRAGAEVGARWLPPGASGEEAAGVPGNQLLLAAALSTGDAQGLRGEVTARSSLSFAGRLGSVEILAGVRYALPFMELFAVGGPGIGQEAGTPNFRILMGAAFGNAGASAGATEPTQPPASGEDASAEGR